MVPHRRWLLLCHAAPVGHEQLEGLMVRPATVPATLAETLTAGIADEVAAVYGDQVVFPAQVVVDDPRDGQRLFPGWPAPVLVIARENQGVVSWGVPLGDPSPPVLVGGNLGDPTPDRMGTQVYAPSVDAFVSARRWDQSCLAGQPLVQAQADVLDADVLAVLRAGFGEVAATAGWPGHTQYRFEGPNVRLMLWSGLHQCDWWLSGADHDALADCVPHLMALSNLREAFWSSDPGGDAVLKDVRAAR
ncbi:hypothetical protein ACFO1B_50070 [Dactylosporangium siamense]|uniref:hypothetical protein n=1 Tax=Dactylosporangium siamense TaxID=685454 RepID=UPI001944FFE3|nr:hypothetical protein [Dactylosporangium siamense]